MSFTIPILLIVWRRPRHLAQLIDSLRPFAPSTIYVSCDGPRENMLEDNELIAQNKHLIASTLNWDCIVRTRFSSTNLGCRSNVASSISWFLSCEPMGIILEDDCIPKPEFFDFCASMLLKYASDLRIWSVSGSSFFPSNLSSSKSYTYSRYPQSWGWATWADRWEQYISDPNPSANTLNCSLFDDHYQYFFWLSLWQKLHRTGKPDTWDYQWTYTCLINSGLTIVPACNLVENIGFDESATHTHLLSIKYSPTNNRFPYLTRTMNRSVSPHTLYDRHLFWHLYASRTYFFITLPLRALSASYLLITNSILRLAASIFL